MGTPSEEYCTIGTPLEECCAIGTPSEECCAMGTPLEELNPIRVFESNNFSKFPFFPARTAEAFRSVGHHSLIIINKAPNGCNSKPPS